MAGRRRSARTKLRDFHVTTRVGVRLVRHVPDFRFILDDLTCCSDQQLHSRKLDPITLLTLLALKHARTAPDLGELLLSWRPLMKAAVRLPGGREALAQILRYVAEVSNRVDRAFLLEELIPSLDDDDVRETTMTLAEELRAEGREQGLEKGLEQGCLQGRRDMLLRQLSRRFGELPQSAIDRVNAAAAEWLDAWAVRIFDAQSLDAAIAG